MEVELEFGCCVVGARAERDAQELHVTDISECGNRAIAKTSAASAASTETSRKPATVTPDGLRTARRRFPPVAYKPASPCIDRYADGTGNRRGAGVDSGMIRLVLFVRARLCCPPSNCR